MPTKVHLEQSDGCFGRERVAMGEAMRVQIVVCSNLAMSDRCNERGGADHLGGALPSYNETVISSTFVEGGR